MILGEYVKSFRKEHGYSMEIFAKMSGLSKGYISMLEANKNPKTGEAIAPTIQTLSAIAKSTGKTLNELLEIISENQMVTVNGSKIKKPAAYRHELSPDEVELLNKYRAASEEKRSAIHILLKSK